MSSTRTSKTLAQLRTQVAFNCSNRSDINSLIDFGLNLAVEEIGRRNPWRSLRVQEDVAIAPNDVSCPLDAYDIVEARIEISSTQVYKLQLYRKERFVEKFPNPSGIPYGWPVAGFFEQGVFYFAPRVSGNYVLRFTKWTLPEPLVLDTDTCPVNANLPLISWATKYCLDSLGMSDSALRWEQVFERSLASTIVSENRGLGIQFQNEEFRPEPVMNSGAPWLDPFVKGDSRS